MMDQKYRENGVETYIHTIFRWQLMLNALQINQKTYTLSSNSQQDFEDSRKALVVSLSEFYQNIVVQHYQFIRWTLLL